MHVWPDDEKTCYDNQHVYISFVFDTFDFLIPNVVDLLHRVQRVTHINVMTHRFMNVVFQKIWLCYSKRSSGIDCCTFVFYSLLINH